MTKDKFQVQLTIFGLLLGVILMVSPMETADAAFIGPTPDGYWLMDETDPPLADELDTGTENDGACDGVNCPSDNSGDAVVNVSQTFDGVDDGILVPFSASRDKIFDWEEDGSFSIEVWFKITADAGNLTGSNETEVIIGRDDNSDDDNTSLHWWIGVRNVDGEGVRVAARMRDQEGDGDGVLITNLDSDYVDVTDGEWHHAVLVKDGDPDSDPMTDDSDILLYVDGILEDTKTVDYTATGGDFGLKSGDTPMTIGFLYRIGTAVPITRSSWFKGGIDQLALFGAALTAAQVEQSYKIGLAGNNLDEEFAPYFLETDFGTSALGYQFSANVEPIGNPAVTSYSLGTAPAGLTLNTSTGDVSWMPTDQQTGLNTFNVSATNTVDTTNQALSVEIVDVCASLDAYWDFNETAEPFDGQVHGEPTHPDDYDAACRPGADTCPTQDGDPLVVNALSFDGVDDGLDVAASAGADLSFDWSAAESFTIEFFMKSDGSGIADGQTEVMVGRVLTGVSTPQWWIGLRDDAGGGVTPRLFARLEAVNGDGDLTPITNATSPTDVTDGAWHHVALVYNHTEGTVSLYADGELEASESITYDGATGFSSTTDNLNFGHWNDGFYFKGSLDEVAFVGDALDEAVLLQHATLNSGRGFCNDAPVISTTAMTTATEGIEYTYDPVADDDEGDMLTWLLDASPTGMTINSTTGAVEWTPGSSVGGTSVPVTVLVYDDFGGTDTQSFNITVGDVNNAPQITTTAPTTATVGALYTYDADAADVDGDTLTWSLTNAPGDMSVDSATGEVTWTPASGVITSGVVILTVSDGTETDTETMTITVSPASSGGGGGGGGGGCFIGSASADKGVNPMVLFGMMAVTGISLMFGIYRKD
ncbi:MAG: hypothetical protein HKM93_01675 [Desulfobacteraceae bacterium]|nr:hypothetical protein [Desulfobacteraceae bacterium]